MALKPTASIVSFHSAIRRYRESAVGGRIGALRPFEHSRPTRPTTASLFRPANRVKMALDISDTAMIYWIDY
jgi:hypothetical protein